MPEKEPLETFVALEFVLEAKLVLFVGEFQEVEEFGAGFVAGEGWGLSVVYDDGDTAVWVEAEEPFFLLFVGLNVAVGRKVRVMHMIV